MNKQFCDTLQTFDKTPGIVVVTYIFQHQVLNTIEYVTFIPHPKYKREWFECGQNLDYGPEHVLAFL